MSEFLLELRFVEPGDGGVFIGVLPLWQRLGHRFFEELMSRGLRFRQLATAVGRDRLALGILGLPPDEPAGERRIWGPLVAEGWRDGRALPPLQEFAVEVGRPIADLSQIPTPMGRRYALVEELPSRAVSQIMADLAGKLLLEIGAGPRSASFPPLAGILALFDGHPAPFELGELSSTAASEWAGAVVPVESFEQYRRTLGAAGAELWTLAAAREHWKRVAS